MGTRGAIGFWKDGIHKVTYNHFDSYPTSLGQRVLEYIHSRSVEQLQTDFDRLRLVQENDKDHLPTKEDIVLCKKLGLADLSVANQSVNDWYCLLRNAQGRLDLYTEAGLMIDSVDFLHDSLFCEYAYIINLTTLRLEIYQGFQKTKPFGRYSYFEPSGNDVKEAKSRGWNGYYAVGLVCEFPLDECPEEFATDNLIRIMRLPVAIPAATVEELFDADEIMEEKKNGN
jgi:hypothetical protein